MPLEVDWSTLSVPAAAIQVQTFTDCPDMPSISSYCFPADMVDSCHQQGFVDQQQPTYEEKLQCYTVETEPLTPSYDTQEAHQSYSYTCNNWEYSSSFYPSTPSTWNLPKERSALSCNPSEPIPTCTQNYY